MTFWLKFSIIIGTISAYSLGVWEMRGWYDSRNVAKIEAKEIESLKKGDQLLQSFNQEWSAVRDKKDSRYCDNSCTLSPDIVRLLK